MNTNSRSRHRSTTDRPRLLRALSAICLLAALPACAQEETATGILAGTVLGPTGAAIEQAQVTLSLDGHSSVQEAYSTESGQFSFSNVVPGLYHLSFNKEGFAAKLIAVELGSGENQKLPPVALAVSTVKSEVDVVYNQVAVAQAEIKEAEEQRLFGVVPNYFVNYSSLILPLS